MTFETVANLQTFVKDFGETVVFTGSGIGFKSVLGIFDNEYTGILGESIEFATSEPRLTCVTNDIEQVAFGDLVEVRSKTYKVVVVMPNGTGMTELMLEAQ